MKKKIFLALLSLMLICMPLYGVYAGDGTVKVVDGAKLLTSLESQELNSRLKGIYEQYGIDVVIVTVTSIDEAYKQKYGYDYPMYYADDIYDYNGYADDGILFLLSMGDRDWAISTLGGGKRAFTDDGQAFIMDEVQPYLSSEEYNKAFNLFADYAEMFIKEAKNGTPYDGSHMPKKPVYLVAGFAIAVAVGIIGGFIYGAVLKSKLKSVAPKREASDYIKRGSFNLTHSRDVFLYRNVKRVLRQSSSSGSGGHGSSSHISSSGRSHGGSHGKF